MLKKETINWIRLLVVGSIFGIIGKSFIWFLVGFSFMAIAIKIEEVTNA